MSLKIKLHVQQMPLTVEMVEICTYVYELEYRGKNGWGKEIENERKKEENFTAYER